MNTSQMVVRHQLEIARNIFQLRLSGEMVRGITEPGQFVHLQTNGDYDTLLRRPISIADVDFENQEMTIIYRTEGNGTRNLTQKKVGDQINVLGPLGNGFPLDSTAKGKTALLVGGGIGVPPLYYLSKQLVTKGVKVKHVIGFSSEEEVFYEDPFAALGETYVTTVDGSYGQKGFVTDAITAHDIHFDVMYACGPTPMLKALEQQYSHKEVYLSLEQRMGCAVGACLACVVHVQGDETGTVYRKVCKDGPVFPVGEVVL